jgi:hypothetical protein
MPQIQFSLIKITTRKLVLAGSVLLVLVIGLVVFLLINTGNTLREDRQAQIQTIERDTNNNQQQVRRILMKRVGNGLTEYIEILGNGEINLYDANMNRLKTRQLGIARTRSIFLDIEESLRGNRTIAGWDGYQIIVDTNSGRTTIDGGGSGGDNGQWDDIIKEIEDTEDTVFAPTPTPRPTATPVIVPVNQITPTMTTVIVPTSIPTSIVGAPTPLPDYRTNPPFTCEEYDYLGRPVAISNVICGAD